MLTSNWISYLDFVIYIFNFPVVTCDPPAEVSHSSMVPDLSQYDYNTMISYTCEFGYYKSSGDFNRTCNEFAQWTNTAPVCSSEYEFNCDSYVTENYCLF